MTRGARVRGHAAALAAGLLACSASDVAFEAQPFRVVLLGDSITAGMVSEPTGPPYAELLTERLGEDFEIVNLGCGGASSPDWTRSRGARMCGGRAALPNLYVSLARKALPADVVTVLLGTNDSLGMEEGRYVAAEEYGEALRELATDLLADGAGLVLLLGPPLDLSKIHAMVRVVAYGEVLQALCQEMPRVVCGPDLSRLLGRQDFQRANVHPNASGHAKIADALETALLGVVQALAKDSSASRSDATSSQR